MTLAVDLGRKATKQIKISKMHLAHSTDPDEIYQSNRLGFPVNKGLRKTLHVCTCDTGTNPGFLVRG